MTIELKPVTSSNIAGVGYDPGSRTLAVQFNGGRTYHYSDVSPEAHAEFVGADSIGRHFASAIRGQYAGILQEEPKEGGQ